MINPNHNIQCYTGMFVMIVFLQQDMLYNSCLLYYKQYMCRNMLNMSLNQYNILNRRLMYMLIMLMCNKYWYRLQDNQYNYLSQILNKSDIMNYMLNKCIHQCNILMNKLMYKLIVQMCNKDKFRLQDNYYNYFSLILNKSDIMNYMLNKFNHSYNILISKMKYRFIRLRYNMDKHHLKYMLNKSYLIQNK